MPDTELRRDHVRFTGARGFRSGVALAAVLGVAGAAIAVGATVAGESTTAGSGAAVQSGEAAARRLFERAVDRRAAGELDAALEELDELVRRYPAAGYPELEIRAAARTVSGEIHLVRGDSAAAAGRFLAVLDGEPESPWSDRARFGLARTFLWLERPMAAAQLLQEVADTAGGDPAAGASAERVDEGAATATSGDELPVRARRLLTLIHRQEIRTAAGGPPWFRAGALSLPGQELDDPIAVTAGAGGKILIVDEGIDLVAIYDLDADSLARLPNQDVRRPWWGPDGVAYLPTEDDGVFPLGLPRIDFFQRRDGERRRLDDLWAGARDPRGRWILLDRDPERVVRFDPDGEYLDTLWEGRGRKPVDVAVDDRGRVYVLDRELDNVVRFSPDGELEGTVASGNWDRPESIAVDGLGNVYVLDRDADVVHVYAPGGEARHRVGPTLPGGIRLRDPRDLDVDDSGRLLIADRGLSSVIVLE